MVKPAKLSSAGFPSQSDIAPVQTVQGGALKDCSSARADDVTVLVCCPLLDFSEVGLSYLRFAFFFAFFLAVFFFAAFFLAAMIKSPIWMMVMSGQHQKNRTHVRTNCPNIN
ncbi:MAG: hypothetical protein AB7E79_11785 [Rhodospirillaceae bacterium]